MRNETGNLCWSDVQHAIRQHGVRSVLAELAGQIYETHLRMAHDHPEKWLFKVWSDKLEAMAEEKPKKRKEE